MKTACPISPRPGGEDAIGLGTDVGWALIGAWNKCEYIYLDVLVRNFNFSVTVSTVFSQLFIFLI